MKPYRFAPYTVSEFLETLERLGVMETLKQNCCRQAAEGVTPFIANACKHATWNLI
jgi:hypothetical protein